MKYFLIIYTVVLTVSIQAVFAQAQENGVIDEAGIVSQISPAPGQLRGAQTENLSRNVSGKFWLEVSGSIIAALVIFEIGWTLGFRHGRRRDKAQARF